MDKKTTVEIGKLSKEIAEVIKNMTDEERARFAQIIVAETIPNFKMEVPGAIDAVRKHIYRNLGKKVEA